MDNSNKAAFATRLNGLNQILGGKDLTKDILSIYFKTLEQYDIDTIINAITKAAVTFKFFPKPVELIEIIEGKTEDRAEIECNKVFEALKKIGPYQSVCFDDPVSQAVIKQHFGGWVKMCADIMEDTVHFSKKDFVLAYSSFQRSGIKVGGYLPGICEIENNSRGIKTKEYIKMIGNYEKCKMVLENKTGQEYFKITDFKNTLKQIRE